MKSGWELACTGCGAKLDEGDEICPGCSSHIEVRTACPDCGHKSSQSLLLCPKCRSIVLGGHPALALAFYSVMVSILMFLLLQTAEKPAEKARVWIIWSVTLVVLIGYFIGLVIQLGRFRRNGGVQAKLRKRVSELEGR